MEVEELAEDQKIIVLSFNGSCIIWSVLLVNWGVENYLDPFDGHPATPDCDDFLGFRLIVAGFVIFAISLAGFVGGWKRSNWLLLLHLVLLFFWIVFFICFTVFASSVIDEPANADAGAGAGAGAGEVGGNYSMWLQSRVNNAKNWNRMKTCFIHRNFCQDFAEDKYKSSIMLIQSGCCKPPQSCGLIPSNSTVDDQRLNRYDCNEWSNDPKTMCFNCQSCKVAVLESLVENWTVWAQFDVYLLCEFIVTFFVGCIAFHYNQRANSLHPKPHAELKTN